MAKAGIAGQCMLWQPPLPVNGYAVWTHMDFLSANTALSSIGRSTGFQSEKLGSIPSWATTWEHTASIKLLECGFSKTKKCSLTLGFSITVVRKILALGLWGFDSLNPNKRV